MPANKPVEVKASKQTLAVTASKSNVNNQKASAKFPKIRKLTTRPAHADNEVF